jgi:hypothetical protein
MVRFGSLILFAVALQNGRTGGKRVKGVAPQMAEIIGRKEKYSFEYSSGQPISATI